MGRVIYLGPQRYPRGTAKHPPRFVACSHCGERHPLIRMAEGTVGCLTAFADNDMWFCRHRGCRVAWIERHAPPK